MGVREAIHSTHWVRWVLRILAALRASLCLAVVSRSRIGSLAFALLVFVSLSGCAVHTEFKYSEASWPSLQKPLQFIASSSCGGFFSIPEINSGFALVGSMKPVAGAVWRYDIQFFTNDGWKSSRFNVREKWYQPNAATEKIKGPESERQASVVTADDACAILVELPYSAYGFPYGYLPAVTKEIAEAQFYHACGQIVLLLSVLGLVMLLGLGVIQDGYKTEGARLFFTIFGYVILGASAIGGIVCVEYPWHQVVDALDYQRFFEQLPRAGGTLLPVYSTTLKFLTAGPPHPSAMSYEVGAFALLSFSLALVWLCSNAVAIVHGWYWIVTPLPLEQLHERCAFYRRSPTADEIKAAVLKATTDKKPWQLEIMRRKTAEFKKHLAEIAQHL